VDDGGGVAGVRGRVVIEPPKWMMICIRYEPKTQKEEDNASTGDFVQAEGGSLDDLSSMLSALQKS